jgi:hypothetical protein
LFTGGQPDGAVGLHLEECPACAQRAAVGAARVLDGEMAEAALRRDEERAADEPPPAPAPHLATAFARRLEHIVRFGPFIRLRANDDKRQFHHLGRLELAVLLLNGVLHRMEAGDGGVPREALVREVCGAVAWLESCAPSFQTTPAERRTLVESLLDELTNARGQGVAFRETYQGYHLQEPGIATAEFRVLIYREHDGEMKYALTEQGLDLLYRLHEVDYFLTVEMELLLLLRQIQRGQFEKALGSLDRLATACGMQRRRIEQLAARIRRDPLSVSPAEIGENDDEVRRQFDEERKLFKRTRAAIDEHAEKLVDVLFNAQERKRLDQLGRIRKGLDRSFTRHQELISDNLQLRRRYHEALERHASLRRRYRQLKLEPEVLEPLLAAPPDERRSMALVALMLPVRRPRLFAPWHLPFRLRAEPGAVASLDAFPVDIDGTPPLDAAMTGFDLLEQARAHAALVTALVEAGGIARLSELAQRATLEKVIAELAHLVAVHVLLLHNVRRVRLGDAGDPFAPVHRLARRYGLPAAAERGILDVTSTEARCCLGHVELTDLQFHLHQGDSDATAPR